MARTLAQLDTQVRKLIGDYQKTTYTDRAVKEAINWAQDLVIRQKGLKIGKRVYLPYQFPTGQLPHDLLVVKRVMVIESVGPLAVFAIILDSASSGDIRIELAPNETHVIEYTMTPPFTDPSFYMGGKLKYGFIAIPSTSTISLELFGDTNDSTIPEDDPFGDPIIFSSVDGSTTKDHFSIDEITTPGDIDLLLPGESGYMLNIINSAALGVSFGLNNSIGVNVGPAVRVKITDILGGVSHIPLQYNLYIPGVG